MAQEQMGFPEALAILRKHANQSDAVPAWPADSWQALAHCGALGWCIPAAYGGEERTGFALLDGYEQLAGACLTTCFILSQRDAACRRLRDSGNETLCRQLLPALAGGEAFATVGLSQLTTSRQHMKPSFVARQVDGGVVLNGAVPWVTGAAKADHLIIGAVLEDGQQILAVLPRGLGGVSVGPPLELMALEGSLTAEVYCDQAPLENRWILAGPAERVMAGGRGGTGGLETSCLALGLAGAAIDYLAEEAKARPELRLSTERLEQTRRTIRQEMHTLAESSCSTEAAATLRARANSLVLRATQAALTASKGTGFLRQHPAQRWARQALFFLVWSCPRPAAEATLAALAPPEAFACP
ncbi:MAG TPA: acyl-CoA dehydrogenase family protein [Gemmataceae bacterium]|nr:acyl-CoA dehydrogenase family protein [Gemmataceae bacterium]